MLYITRRRQITINEKCSVLTMKEFNDLDPFEHFETSHVIEVLPI